MTDHTPRNVCRKQTCTQVTRTKQQYHHYVFEHHK